MHSPLIFIFLKSEKFKDFGIIMDPNLNLKNISKNVEKQLDKTWNSGWKTNSIISLSDT